MRKALYLSILLLCGCNFESRPLATAAADGGLAPSWTPAGRAGASAAQSGASTAQYIPATTAVGLPPMAATAGNPATGSAPATQAPAALPDASTRAADPVDLEPDAGAESPDAGGASGPGGPTRTDAAVPMTSGKALVEQLIDAVNALFDPAARSGKGNASAELRQWRMLARRSGALTAEVVSQALGAIEQRGVCFARPQACVSVCAVIAESCTACAADASCEAALARVCGPSVASCPAP